MGYKVVKGGYYLFYHGQRRVGSKPDGDSVWFKPDDPAGLRGLQGRNAKFNGGGFANLRLEGIDALEIHFQQTHQEPKDGLAARDFLLKAAGFESVEYAPAQDNMSMTVRTASPHPLTGYILTRSIDPYGRPVAFAFTGDPEEKDGQNTWLDVARMNQSLNVKLMRAGHVYPAFYTGLPADLRRRLANLTVEARRAPKGLWPADVSWGGENMASLARLEELAVWPKLFRRLASYFSEGNKGLKDFFLWLRADEERDDQVWVISEGSLGNLHDVVKISGSHLKMVCRPEDLVVVPR